MTAAGMEPNVPAIFSRPVMRFVMNVTLPVETFNEAVRDGSAGRKIGRILEETKPESVYFTARDGKRGAIIIVDMKEVSEMPKYAEPWFLTFNAAVDFLPTMSPEDLGKAGLDSIASMWK